jgi:hypothetical protein
LHATGVAWQPWSETAGFCPSVSSVSVQGGNSTDGTSIHTFTCNDTPAMIWTL